VLESCLAALAGLLIGSFLNVCIYRLPRDLSVVAPRSFCPSCERTIAWYDNVPVLSYAFLRGRCRHCHAGISLRYPLVELLTALCFFGAVWASGPNLVALKYCVFSAILIALVFADIEERILPDEFTLGGIVAGIVLAVVAPSAGGIWRFLIPVRNPRALSFIEAVFAAAVSSAALWAVGFLYEKIRHREGLGFGDVKMVAMIGAFLGLQGVLLTLVVGSVLGSVTGLAFILIARKDAATYELPFGAFLGAAALGIAFFGARLLGWYGGFGL
jgi:leader peptidase (prepilin peptidase)/N-methyltransferase